MPATTQAYDYDAAGRLVIIKNDAGNYVQTFVYGATNARLMTNDIATNQFTYYVWSGSNVIAEYTETASSGNPQWTKSYVYAGGRLLSTATSNGAGGEITEYQHSDQLGTRLVTNQQTGAVYEQAVLPFGTALSAETTGATNRRFTSYDRAVATGLDYAVNRTYDSGQSRFTTVDPLGMAATSLMSPQSLNLYAYVENDPVNFVDPNGLNAAGAGTSYGYFSHPMGVAYYVDGVLSDARLAWAHIWGNNADWITHSFGGMLTTRGQYTGGENSRFYGYLVHFFNYGLSGVISEMGGGASPSPQDKNSCPKNMEKFFDKKILDIFVGLSIKYDVDVMFITALSAWETNWGKTPAFNNKNNLFGLAKEGSDGKEMIKFNSYENSAASWGKTFGEAVRGAKTIQDFATRLQEKGYNTKKAKEWYTGVTTVNVHKWLFEICGRSFI